MHVYVCTYARGRSGTFAAAVIGTLERIRYPLIPLTVDRLVDIIVDMREHRDGLVETPAQFHYLTRILGLNDYNDLEHKCHKNASDKISININSSNRNSCLFKSENDNVEISVNNIFIVYLFGIVTGGFLIFACQLYQHKI